MYIIILEIYLVSCTSPEFPFPQKQYQEGNLKANANMIALSEIQEKK